MADRLNLTVRIIKVLSKDESRDGWTELRIVAWANDQKEFPPKIEKRQFFQKDGEAKMGKCVAMNYQDFTLMCKYKNQISSALYNGEWRDAAEEADVAQPESASEVPF